MVNIVIGVLILCLGYLFLSPDARIPRTIKAVCRRAVLHPKVRQFLGLPIAPPVSLRALTNLVGSWTSTTFVSPGGVGACNHIGDEAKELLAIVEKIMTAGEPVDPRDQYELSLELADIQILLMDIAYCRHVDLTDATLLKHYINSLRKWSPPDERGVQHHIEEEVKDTSVWKRTPEQELKLLKRFPGMGKAKLEAIVAKPDGTIAKALAEVLNEQEPLQGYGDFKP